MPTTLGLRGSYKCPRGSKYPNSRVLIPKILTLRGLGTSHPYYLGTWTLTGFLRVFGSRDLNAWGGSSVRGLGVGVFRVVELWGSRGFGLRASGGLSEP